MINAVLWILMGLSGFAATLAVWTLFGRGLIRAFPVLTILLTTIAIRTAWLLSVLIHSSVRDYIAAWPKGQWVIAWLHIAVVIEAFVRVCRHFPKMRWFGAAVGLIFFAASVGASYATAIAGNAVYQDAYSLIVRTFRYEDAGCFVFIALIVAFFSQFDFVPMRPNVRKHLTVLSAFFACLFAGSLIIEMGSTQYWSVFAAQILATAGPAACYLAWASMAADGEKLPAAATQESHFTSAA